jgi:hypothetical protein
MGFLIGEMIWNFADFATPQGKWYFVIVLSWLIKKVSVIHAYMTMNQIGIYIVCLALPCLFFKTKINLFVLGAITGVNRVVVNRKGIFTRDRQPKSAARYLKLRYLNL